MSGHSFIQSEWDSALYQLSENTYKIFLDKLKNGEPWHVAHAWIWDILYRKHPEPQGYVHPMMLATSKMEFIGYDFWVSKILQDAPQFAKLIP